MEQSNSKQQQPLAIIRGKKVNNTIITAFLDENGFKTTSIESDHEDISLITRDCDDNLFVIKM